MYIALVMIQTLCIKRDIATVCEFLEWGGGGCVQMEAGPGHCV